MEEAIDGVDAMETMAGTPPDLVLLDLEMPRLDGMGVLLRMRRDGNLKRIPAMVVTGLDVVDYHVQALEAGADDFLIKPFHAAILLARAGNLLARSRAERRNDELMRNLEAYVSQPARVHDHCSADAEHIEATILFSDLRGFTATSFNQDMRRLFVAVNEVLAYQSELVLTAGGYVDKFSGDGMLAVFEGDDGPVRACEVARDVIQWARGFAGIAFWNPPPIGLGLHYGFVMRGDLGSVRRREFTVLGSTVNVAARLCGVAGALEAIASDSIVARVGDSFDFDAPRQVGLKGLPADASTHRLRVD